MVVGFTSTSPRLVALEGERRPLAAQHRLAALGKYSIDSERSSRC